MAQWKKWLTVMLAVSIAPASVSTVMLKEMRANAWFAAQAEEAGSADALAEDAEAAFAEPETDEIAPAEDAAAESAQPEDAVAEVEQALGEDADGEVMLTPEDGEDAEIDAEAMEADEAGGFAIISQPQDCVCELGGTAAFTVLAQGDGLTYRWQYQNLSGSGWRNSLLKGYNKDTLHVYANRARIGMKYRCVVSDASGAELVTAEAQLTNTSTALTITRQPQDVAGKIGDTAVFAVQATGSGLSYQWQYQSADGGAWLDSSLSGSNRASLTVPVTKGRVGMRFRCVVRDSSGAEVTSNAATLTSGDSPSGSLAITTQPTDQSCELNESAVFTVAATGSGLTYQWQYQASGETDWSDSTLTGAKTASLTVRLTRSRMGMKFRCVVTDSTGASVTSEAATLNGNARYEIDGVIYELSNGIMSAVDYIGSADAITVQQTVAGYTVTALGESAFENKTTLRAVTLPGTITEMGEAAFAGCTNLESVQWR